MSDWENPINTPSDIAELLHLLSQVDLPEAVQTKFHITNRTQQELLFNRAKRIIYEAKDELYLKQNQPQVNPTPSGKPSATKITLATQLGETLSAPEPCPYCDSTEHDGAECPEGALIEQLAPPPSTSGSTATLTHSILLTDAHIKKPETAERRFKITEENVAHRGLDKETITHRPDPEE